MSSSTDKKNQEKPKQKLEDKGDLIVKDLKGIYSQSVSNLPVARDFMRTCKRFKFLRQNGVNFEEIQVYSEVDDPTNLVLTKILNFLVLFVDKSERLNEVEIFLKRIGLSEYKSGFIEHGFDELFVMVKEGLDKEDFKAIGITKRGHQKKITCYLNMIKNKEFKVNPLHISFREFNYEVANDHASFTQLLFNHYGDQSTIVRILKICCQSLVVSFLGHLGETLYFNAGIRCKDVKGFWNIYIKRYDASKYRNTSLDYIGVIHERKEQVCKSVNHSKLCSLFTFTWQLEIQFDSLEKLKNIKSIEARILSVDWSGCEVKDMKKEERDEIESSFRTLFGNLKKSVTTSK